MTYLALFFFVSAAALTGLEIGNVIHGAGGAVGVLLFLSWVTLAIKALAITRAEHHRHAHHH
ncbi:MAG TPA: hypothetical protein VHJ20_09500 [Polyangia bacterium]|nr:hypothetical protein [Polyangia bacterium]